MKTKQCCEEMKERLKFNCKSCKDKYECPDSIVVQTLSQGYGIIIHDGGMSFISIKFCPWCGKKLKK